MSFKQQILATFIGSIFGFAFSLVLFYVSELAKTKWSRKRLVRLLKHELNFNISFVKNLLEDLSTVLQHIAADDPEPYIVLKFKKFQRLFILEGFNQGYLYERLDADDIAQLDEMLGFFNDFTDRWAYEGLQELKVNPVNEKQKIYGRFEFLKKRTKENLALLEKVRAKL